MPAFKVGLGNALKVATWAFVVAFVTAFLHGGADVLGWRPLKLFLELVLFACAATFLGAVLWQVCAWFLSVGSLFRRSGKKPDG